MILLDTNVISEPLKLTGDVGVLTWIDAQMIETLHNSLEQRILRLFAGRIMHFDAAASEAYAALSIASCLSDNATSVDQGCHTYISPSQTLTSP